MTREEVIKIFNTMLFFGKVDCTKEEAEECFKLAISDMEKHIPKKPIPIDYKQYVGAIRNAEYLRGSCWCPNCRTEIRSGRHCTNCGQLLDWR